MAVKLTQSQFIKKLAETVGVANKVAKAFTTGYADLAVAETKKNGMAVLPGIGRLVRVDRKARMGRNPATGEAIKIPAKKVVKFRVAKAVKDAIVPPKKK
jgi:DNA-binding protein HU-beta